MRRAQAWLHSAPFDLAFIIAPPFIATTLVFLFRDRIEGMSDLPVWAWFAFVLCIDVAHVYSTLFRTYFNSREFTENRLLLSTIPIAAWLGGVLIYSASSAMFWRVLAYIAVFHFIRQQYGFMMLYSRGEALPFRRVKVIDKVVVYLAALYPIVYWHTHLPRNFHWFVDGDFLSVIPGQVEPITRAIYLITLLLYLGKELLLFGRTGEISVGKNCVILGTALSWYVGIVAFDSDMAFTVTNVVSHGVPYIGLIWIYGRKQQTAGNEISSRFRYLFSTWFVPIFLGLLVFFAYVEEGLWDALIWRDHESLFGVFLHFPKITDHATLSWIVPLLVLPQLTHYIIDGFIWKLRDKSASWQTVLFQREAFAT